MKKVDNKQFIWAEKYRPQTVEDVILPHDVKQKFESYTKEGRFPHILLSSVNPGVGKCLDYSEELELYVSDELYEILK